MKAVILAGGKGERLRPLTNSMPKALAPVNGVPIIKAQIDSLALLGITEFVILTGYKASMIQRYLESVYRDSQLEINCFESPESYSPADRLLATREALVGEFILLYCDNLISDPESIQKIIQSTSALTFLVEKRDSGNMAIIPSVEYHIKRSADTPMVELGYIKVYSNSFFDTLSRSDSLQTAIQDITKQTECSAVVTQNSLNSVSDMARFNDLRRNRKTILLDRDGVINRKMPHREYLNRFEDYTLIQENVETLSKLYSPSTDFIIITNQPGVATGQVNPDFLENLHDLVVVDLLLKGVSVIGIYVCPHHWEENCECRKPKPGMINQAISEYNLDRKKLVYVGDEQKDMDAAMSANILGVLIVDERDIASGKSTLEESLGLISGYIS